MMARKVTEHDVVVWLGDDAHKSEAVRRILAEVANGDWSPEVLYSDIMSTADDEEEDNG